MQRVWLRVALAAGAGLVSVVICCSALLAIARFIDAWTSYQYGDVGSYTSDATPPPPSTTLVVFIVTTVILELVSFSLPPLALGARVGRALIIAVLYSLGFVALVLGVIVISFPFPVTTDEVLYPLAFLAWVGPSALGSLIAVQGEGRMVSRILPATLIVAALAIYCASVIAFRLSGGGERGLSLAPLVVAASSWVVLPAIAASLRSD